MLVRRIVLDVQHREYLLRADLPRLDEVRAEIAVGNARRDRTIVACAAALGGLLWVGLGVEPAWLGGLALLVAAGYLVFRRH